MSTTSPDSERALILTPLGRDAALTAEALAQVGITSCICPDVTALRCAMVEGAGVAVITQEVLAADNRAALVETLSQQPIWSDFPFVVFGPRQPPHDGIHLDPLGHLGNVTLLERPVRRQIMLSAVQAALRSRRRQYEARRAIEQRDQFLAMLGHELRNPLTAILLSAQLIERTAGVDPRLERHHAVIGRQARQLHRLVDDLLDVARVTTGKVGLKRERINLGELVRHSVQSLVGDNQAGPLVSLRIADEEVWVSGDPVRLEQIFSNLLSNALKYTPASKNIEVSLESTGGEAIVRIKDEGIGVAAEMLPRIFDLFTQADTALDRARGGMGVGLTLVKALVELHQGGIAAFSEGVGRGAEFVVRLPLSDDAAEIAVTQSLSIPASA
ncbi:MAG TPA: HAMP domain-containing sensor histidine kinase, partial [Terriglobales bacterium]|nr:HAMP domain-containing sensor histidine kinase [Terriglobales bacterium]